jgi:hypothetical protein
MDVKSLSYKIMMSKPHKKWKIYVLNSKFSVTNAAIMADPILESPQKLD